MTKKTRKKSTKKRSYNRKHERAYRIRLHKVKQVKIYANKCTMSIGCNEPPIGITNKCLKHWSMAYAGTAKRCGYSRSEFSKVVLALWHEQKGKCAISGLDLVPGLNIEIDHIMPLSRGGSSKKENLRLIHKFINKLKDSFTDDEMVQNIKIYCPLLMEWAAQKEITNNGL